jgi:hypothetical protein
MKFPISQLRRLANGLDHAEGMAIPHDGTTVRGRRGRTSLA